MLHKQGEFYDVPAGSAWSRIATLGPRMMSWTPPFGIGNHENFR